jgi:gluconate 5-dehydrogenase
MDVNLKGFRAVITGGSNGLGFEMAKALLSKGATVAIAARPGERLEKAYAALKGGGFDVHALEMDVRDESAVEAAARWVAESWGRLDMVVNNAGLSQSVVRPDQTVAPLPFFEIEPRAFYEMVETNFIGYFLVARAFVPIMIRGGGGRLINVSTGIRTMTAKGMLPYGPARAGAEAMSVILSGEMESYNVMVNILLPGGPCDTGFVTDEVRAHYEGIGLLPASIMNEAIVFLASDKAAGLTGERIIATEFSQWLAEKGFD